MTHLKKLAIAFAVTSCLSSFEASAQQTGRSWYVSPNLNLISPDSGFQAGSRGEGLGVRAGTAVAPNWDVQVGTTYARARDGGYHYYQNTLGVDGLYLFSRDKFRPFVLAGVGASYDRVNKPNLESSGTSPYINAGVGFQYAFNEKWALQADLRRVHTYLRDDKVGSSSNNDYLTVGVNYAF